MVSTSSTSLSGGNLVDGLPPASSILWRYIIVFFITSNDVLHAFSIPAAFVKCDAVPRRLNAISLNFPHPRVFYRQCSELCRVRHSYIPIKLEVVIPNNAS